MKNHHRQELATHLTSPRGSGEILSSLGGLLNEDQATDVVGLACDNGLFVVIAPIKIPTGELALRGANEPAVSPGGTFHTSFVPSARPFAGLSVTRRVFAIDGIAERPPAVEMDKVAVVGDVQCVAWWAILAFAARS